MVTVVCTNKLSVCVHAETDPQDDAVIHEMKRLLDKVDEMKEQRKQKEQELRQQLLADDITGALVIYKGVSQDVSSVASNLITFLLK